MATNFAEIKNRDAWSTIRGFVYQVDLTIDRWLSLEGNQLLELEKGEDIDVVNRDLSGEELSRRLEQVKYRESTISLNLQPVLEILKNFYVHKENNPGCQLFFRFVTNTKYNIERPAIFENGESGISVWQQLASETEIANDDQRLIAIQKHLIQKIDDQIEPEDDNTSDDKKQLNDKWRRFKAFVADAKQFHRFITEFEWSIGVTDDVMISDAIKKRLVELKFTGADQAELLYSRLFLYVFKVLTTRGEKILSKSNLVDQTKLPGLSAQDEELQKFVKSILNEVEERLSTLEDFSQGTALRLAELAKDVNEMQKIDAVFNYQLSTLSINPPAGITKGSRRKQKVDEILSLVKIHSWIFLQGINGTGKSQLALLVAERFTNRYWLDLRAFNKDEEKSALLVEAFLERISGRPVHSDRIVWLKDVIAKLPENSLIVINDLPELNTGSRLDNLLAALVKELGEANRLLTTSNFKISGHIKNELEDALCEYNKLEFSDSEIIEYLLNQGADDSIGAYVSLIAAVSHRNPRLLSAVIFRLKQINWGRDANALFDVILNKEFSGEVLRDTQKSIRKYIEDEQTKELLYRLSLIHWDFRFQVVQEISAIEDKIPHPNEKLDELLNIWIQQNDVYYLMSPLVYDIGENNLVDQVKKQVHKTLAQSILSDKELNQITASRCIHGFLKADCYDEAGTVLLMLLRSAQTKEQILELKKWGYLSYWSELEIPKQMNVVTRAFLRTEQIRLHQELGEDASSFVSSLASYIDEKADAGISSIVRIVALMSTSVGSLERYTENVLFVIRNYQFLPDSYKEALDPQLFSGLLWVPIQQMESFQQLKLWLQLVSDAEAELHISVFADEIAGDAISVICNRIAVQEGTDPSEKIAQLEMLAQHFLTNGHEKLSAIASSYITTITFNVLKDQEKAESIVLNYSASFTSEDAKYILYQNLGKLLVNAGLKERSSDWLLKAAAMNCEDQIDFVDTLIYAASVVSETNPTRAVAYCEQAVRVAAENEKMTDLVYIQSLGELGIAYWKNNEFEKSFHAFEQSISRIFETEDHSNAEWIRIFSWAGHVLGYLSASVARDRLPQQTADGGKYTKPYQGIIILNTKDLSDHFRRENMPLVLVHLAIYADGLNRVEDAYIWSQKAFDRARTNGNEKMIYMVSFVCAQYALINFKLAETFESYLLGSAVASNLKGSPEEKYKQLEAGSLNEIIAAKPSEGWNAAEETTINFAIIPLFVMVLTRNFENHREKEKSSKEFLLMIRDYIPKASNVFYWETVYELFTRILNKEISQKELTDRANTFSEKDRRPLQTICILGLIYLTEDAKTAIEQVLNVFPYLSKIQTSSRSVIKFALIPFVKIISKQTIQKTYVGNRKELDQLLAQIEAVDITDLRAMQYILQPAVEYSGISTKADRRAWLLEYQEI